MTSTDVPLAVYYATLMAVGPLFVLLVLRRWSRGRSRRARGAGALIAAIVALSVPLLLLPVLGGYGPMEGLAAGAIFFVLPMLVPLAFAVVGGLTGGGRRGAWLSAAGVMAVSVVLGAVLAVGPRRQWAWLGAVEGCGPVHGTAEWLRDPAAYMRAYEAGDWLTSSDADCALTPCWATCTGKWSVP